MDTHLERRVARSALAESEFASHDRRILCLQGGGALGAYHAGVYEGAAAAGFAPNWVVGISIGAINAALIAGNAPEDRIRALREFWDLVSSRSPPGMPALLDFARPMMNRMAAASALLYGIPGFFTPRMPPPHLAQEGTLQALSYYDTEPLRATLNKLVDFDRINHGDVRLSLGAVNARTGESVYFDSNKDEITASHVMASGALPPGFPPVLVDGDYFFDGGVVSNTPMQYLAKNYRMDALIITVDLFSGLGDMPKNLDQVQERVKDLQFQSKAQLSFDQARQIEGLRSTLAEVIEKMPPELRADPQVKKLEDISHRGAVSVIHLINRHDTRSSDFKDYEFSRMTVNALWQGGKEDMEGVLKHPENCHVHDIGNGMRFYDP